MYTYYIIKAGQAIADERVAKAVKNFNYTNENVICISYYGRVNEIQSEYNVRAYFKDFTTSLEELAQKYIDQKNTEIQQGE